MEINRRIKEYKIKGIGKVIGAFYMKPQGWMPYDSPELKAQLLYLCRILKKAIDEGRMTFKKDYPISTGTGHETYEEGLAADILFKFAANNLMLIGMVMDIANGRIKNDELNIKFERFD